MIKKFIANEPVITSAVVALVAALIPLLLSFGLDITPEQADALQAAVLPVMAVIFLAARGFVTPNGKVVEHEKDGVVLAGQANELPTDTEVRNLGEDPLIDLSTLEDDSEGI